eukprot:TRINITY_DN40578_c0_g1_i1.p1 TRINITY_DN40578_c0_g1~~TRINITY_DN40578_c0_g1_i1.p1  ORF type:complete len:498 (-),score=70.53 TRINITY_DN40578_c0_g1_i1:1133-2593(-)
MNSVIVLFLCFAVSLHAHPIKHVVLIMLENHSFDHMLGWLNRNDSRINGLTGKEYNRIKADDPSSKKYYVNDKGTYSAPFDPGHSVPDTTEEIFGCAGGKCNGPDPAPMNGFVQHHHKEKQPWAVMDGFSPERVPIISTLAMEGALFDNFFASVPGPTQPNRAYLHSGTSHGMSDNNPTEMKKGLPQKTIFAKLEESGKDWRIFYHDVTYVTMFHDLRTKERTAKIQGWTEWKKATQKGTLPEYTFLSPRWNPNKAKSLRSQDQHPTHDVAIGEALLKEIYEDLRASPKWNETALIVTYDEHGGFYDHVSPPMDNVPNPDGLPAKYGPPFNFTRLGVRIPFIVVSPWVNKNTLFHAPGVHQKPMEHSQWELSSVIATLDKIFDLPGGPMTKRIEWAAHFEDIFLTRKTPRTDLPRHLPPAPKGIETDEWDTPATGLQWEAAHLMSGLTGAVIPEHPTQNEMGIFVREQVCAYMKEKLGDAHKCEEL